MLHALLLDIFYFLAFFWAQLGGNGQVETIGISGNSDVRGSLKDIGNASQQDSRNA